MNSELDDFMLGFETHNRRVANAARQLCNSHIAIIMNTLSIAIFLSEPDRKVLSGYIDESQSILENLGEALRETGDDIGKFGNIITKFAQNIMAQLEEIEREAGLKNA